MRRAPWLLAAVVWATGCGLVLDMDPRQRGGPELDGGAPDTGPVGPRDGGSLDASAPDAAPTDASSPVADGGMVLPEPILCTSSSGCAPGMYCFYAPEPPGVCTTLCGSDAECDMTTSRCNVFGFPSCSPSCNPRTNEGCPAGTGCAFYDGEYLGTSIDITWCLGAGTGVQGDLCESGGVVEPTLCAPDFWCLPSTPATCMRKCRVGGSDCPGGLYCAGFMGDGMFVGGVEYGVCI